MAIRSPHKMSTVYEAGHPALDLGHAQICGGI